MQKIGTWGWVKRMFIAFIPPKLPKKPKNKKQVSQLIDASWAKMQHDLTSKTTGCSLCDSYIRTIIMWLTEYEGKHMDIWFRGHKYDVLVALGKIPIVCHLDDDVVHDICRFHEVLFEIVQTPEDRIHLEKLVFELTT